SFSAPGTNPNFEGFLAEYLEQVKYVRTYKMDGPADVQASWNTYSNWQPNRSALADTTTVGPLLPSLWNQDNPYNEFCPLDATGPGGHTYAGCVATAMSQIMNYYKFPLSGSGQHSYNAPGYGTQTANFGATAYDWDAMQSTINTGSGEGIPANALLQYHAGVSVNMGYGGAPDGSGAYSTDVPYALKTYFKYSTTVQYVARSGYTVTNWETMLLEQLNANKPMYYSGVSPDGGHAWVCDGYQTIGTSTNFHFNFGWSGQSNGYYTSTNPDGFTSQQSIVRNFIPGTGYPYGCTSKILEFTNGSVEDGSGPLALYNNNLACTWLIAPLDTIMSITANFVKFDVSSGDSLYFYDGADAGANLLAAYSGNTLPSSVTTTGNKMFIKFVTDASVQGTGWLIEYTANLPSLCAGTKNMVEPSGAFTDGSGPYNYKNNSACKFKIQPPYAMNLTLTFDEFDLVQGDEVTVYSLASNALLATLTGNQIPDPITVPLNGLFVIFKSNNYYTSGGFSASYSVGNVGTEQLPGISSLNISPNPASDFIMVRAYNNKSQQMQFSIVDMTGKNLYTETFQAQKGNIEKSIDVSNFKSGMYFLTVKNTEGKVTQKVIVGK
ncbi:MAG: C10 family peptidase, partial [Bacteroidota bacterium]